MKYWEFLIQKEGDESWLPLETHQVEVLEGRYRVVAHTDRTNTPVDIRVSSQMGLTEGPPRQRVRIRTSQTNDAGLVVVIPYVHLKPGQWELTCSSQNAATDPDIWQYAVQLQVFALDEGSWSAEWPMPEKAETDAAAAETVAVGGSSQLEPSAPANLDLPLTQAQLSLQNAQNSLHNSSQGDPHNDTSNSRSVEIEAGYKIFLRQYAFLAQADRPMVIVGQVQAPANLPTDLFTDRGESHLWLRLQNPETAQVIMEAHRPINLARLPADFKVKIQLPAHVTTHMVFGEVSLRSAPSETQASEVETSKTEASKTKTAKAKASSTLLCSTAFTITAGIAHLLEAIANADLNEFEDRGTVLSTLGSADYANEISPENSLLPSAVPPLETNVHSVSPAVGVVLPPRLYHTVGPTAGTGSTGRIDLPSFLSSNPLIVSDPPKARLPLDRTPAESELIADSPSDQDTVAPASSETTAVKLPPMVAKPAQFMNTSIEDDDLETAQIAALLEDINGDLETIAPPSEPVAASRTSSFLSTTPEIADEPLGTAAEAESSTKPDNPYHRRVQQQASAKAAFSTLKLKDHFMQRLSNLTHDEINQGTKFAEDLQVAGVSSDGSQAFTRSDAPANNEVVIFDEPSAAVEDIPTVSSGPIPSEPVPSGRVPSGPTSSVPMPSVPMPSVPMPPLPTPLAKSRRQHQNQRQDQRQSQLYAQPSSVEIQSDNISSPPQSNISSQRLMPHSPVNVPTTSLSDSDRNRQLRLERLRQRQEARAARDEQLLPAEPSAQPPIASGLSSALVHRPSVSDELPDMVLPIISVPMGDLVAGDRVTITVRTRPSVFKPFIKLWMIDRQSRSVVGEPKLLTDLRPDALGDLQSSTELLVPMDCLDVQIAAIAIDMATQQESNKAIVNRHVIPPIQSLPPLRSFQEREWYR
ncbi:MAG: hypothetical protein WA949_16690 [Phormidesmis sp.]